MWFFFWEKSRHSKYGIIIKLARHARYVGELMIGLKFIADTFHMEYKIVAEVIGVSKQTFQDWIKERRKR
jgi:hypothetical protein